MVMWISATFPRLRIDQLMAFCWKVLLPFGFLQIIVNAFVLNYVTDSEALRDVLLLVTSGTLLVAMSVVVYRATRQPSREERLSRLVMARSTAE
jgi:NADH-quinone oxidoreductase subunit H